MAPRITTGSSTRARPARVKSGARHDRREQRAAVKPDVRHRAGGVGAVLRNEIAAKINPVRQYVSEKPVRSALAGGGIAVILVLGVVLGRRWRGVARFREMMAL